VVSCARPMRGQLRNGDPRSLLLDNMTRRRLLNGVISEPTAAGSRLSPNIATIGPRK
jgi:hypothetical protein